MSTANAITVNCEPYGTKELIYPAAMAEQERGRELLSVLEREWEKYWPTVIETTSEMAEQVLGIYDFSAGFETHDFTIQVYDMRNWENQIPLWITFIDSRSDGIVPIFDVTFEGFEVVSSQPVF